MLPPYEAVYQLAMLHLLKLFISSQCSLFSSCLSASQCSLLLKLFISSQCSSSQVVYQSCASLPLKLFISLTMLPPSQAVISSQCSLFSSYLSASQCSLLLKLYISVTMLPSSQAVYQPRNASCLSACRKTLISLSLSVNSELFPKETLKLRPCKIIEY
jgi:hypothetical protein